MRQVESLGGKRERKPRERWIENVQVADTECNVVESLTSDLNEPKSLRDAINSSESVQWNQEVKSEYESD